MNEKNFSPSRESGTSFENGDQVDVRASKLISLEELERRRRREIFEREALGMISPEQRPLTPHERLGQLNVQITTARRNHIEKLNQGDFEQAA